MTRLGVWLERAECGFLKWKPGRSRAGSSRNCSARRVSIDKAAAYRIKVDLHVVKSENAAGHRQRSRVPGLFASHSRTSRANKFTPNTRASGRTWARTIGSL